MSTSENKIQIQQERERIATQHRKKLEQNLNRLRSEEKEEPPPDIDLIEDSIPLDKIQGAVSRSKSGVPETKFNMGNIIHVVDGKIMSAENAFNTYNWSAYVAAALTMYHESIGWEHANNELFAGILTNCMHIYGPKQDINMGAVAASIEYIDWEEMHPYDAMRTAAIAIKTDAPARVFADAVVLGKTAMVVDALNGKVEVQEEPDLSIRATEALAPLLVATVPKPVLAMEKVVADLGKFDVSLSSVEQQLQASVNGNPFDIKETNPHRRLTKTPGLMASGPYVPGKHGVYQRCLECVQVYHKDPPQILVVPEYNWNASGSYDSAGTMSAVIPLPEKPEHYSLLLYSVMADYEDGLRSLAITEARMRDDAEYRKQVKSARAVIHAPYEDKYDDMRGNGQGLTPKDLRYTTLWDASYTGTQDIINGASTGRFNNHPVLMRAADYFQARKRSLEGEFIWVDLPLMVGLYFSPTYIQRYFADKTLTEDGSIKHARGFYVMRPKPDKVEGLYSSFIEKYIYSHLTGSILGGDARDKLLLSYLKSYQSQRSGTKVVQKIIQDLRYCYDSVEPTLTKVGMLVPGYSATKAFKHRTLFCDFEIDDYEFQSTMGEGIERPPPPENESENGTSDIHPPPPADTGGDEFDSGDYGDEDINMMDYL